MPFFFVRFDRRSLQPRHDYCNPAVKLREPAGSDSAAGDAVGVRRAAMVARLADAAAGRSGWGVRASAADAEHGTDLGLVIVLTLMNNPG